MGDDDLVYKWRHILDDSLNVKSFFISTGLDLNALGNSVVSIFFPFQRWLTCMHCKKQNIVENVKDWTFKDLKWKGICPECDTGTEFEAEDKYVRDISGLNLIRWSIENIDIKYNEITGKSRYYYSIPQRIKKSILSNDKHTIAETPLRFIQAIKEDKSIELDKDNVFHMKQATLAEEDQGYGKPIIMAAMKDAFYLEILRKANEAIAFQYIVPLTVLFPEGNGNANPYQHLNLAEWRTRIEEEILKWKDDANYIPLMPVPLGSKQIFGDAKALMITPEIRAVTEQIITGMGVPPEFVFGGMQWSGSHVSLRMIENQLLRHREQMSRMLDFIIDRISRFFRLKKINVKFADFKMADDIQLKQILGNLVSGQKVSLQSYIQDFNLDRSTEQKELLNEAEFTNKLQRVQLIAQAEAQAEAMLITARAQTKAQLEQKKITDQVQQGDVMQQLAGALAVQRDQVQQQAEAQQAAQGAQGQPQGGEQAQAPAAPQQPSARPGEHLSDGLEAQGGSRGGTSITPQFDNTPMDPRFIARQMAVQLGSSTPEEKDRVLHNMKNNMPNLYTLVTSQQQLIDNSRQTMTVEKNAPKQKPPRRNKGGLL